TLFAGLMAWPLLGQRPTAVLLCGIALAMCGAGLLPAAGGFHMGPGEWWTLGGAGLFALQIVVLARYAPRSDTPALASVQAAMVARRRADPARRHRGRSRGAARRQGIELAFRTGASSAPSGSRPGTRARAARSRRASSPSRCASRAAPRGRGAAARRDRTTAR